MKTKRVYVITLFLLIICSTFTYAQSEENNSIIPLLDGRLTVKMPKGSEIEPRQWGIMSAPQASRSETRVVFQEGEKKLVLMTYETFSIAGEHFEENLKHVLPSWEEYEGVKLILNKVSPKEYFVYPSTISPNDEAILIQGMYYINFDNTVQQLVIYANSEFYKDLDTVKALADEILTSVEDGDVALDSPEGTKSFFLSNAYELKIDFPEGFVYIIQTGVDFLVHIIRPLSEFGTPPEIVGMYVGWHPSFHYARLKKSEIKLKTIKRKFLGEKVKWAKYSPKSHPNEMTMEVIVPLSRVEEHLLLHVFISSNDEKDLERLLNILDTARVSRKNSD